MGEILNIVRLSPVEKLIKSRIFPAIILYSSDSDKVDEPYIKTDSDPTVFVLIVHLDFIKTNDEIPFESIPSDIIEDMKKDMDIAHKESVCEIKSIIRNDLNGKILKTASSVDYRGKFSLVIEFRTGGEYVNDIWIDYSNMYSPDGFIVVLFPENKQYYKTLSSAKRDCLDYRKAS